VSTAKSFAKNSLALSIASLSVIALGALYRIFIARYLGDESFGKYVFITTYVSYFSALSLLGIRPVIVREVAKRYGLYRPMLREGLVIRAASTLAALGIAYGILLFMNKSSDVHAGVLLQGGSLLAIAAMDLFEGLMVAKESSSYIAISSVVSNTVKVIAGVFLLMQGYGLLAIITLYAVTSVMNAALSWLFFRKVYSGVKVGADDTIPNLRRFMFKESLPFFYVNAIGKVYYKNDILILSILKGDRVVGWYGAAYLPVDALLAIAHASASAGTPIMSRFFAEDRERLRDFHNKMCKYLGLMFLATAITLTAVGPEILTLLFGRQFSRAAPVLRLLGWMPAAEALTLGLALGLVVAYKQHLMFRLTILNASINVALCLALIWRFSYVGAAIGTVVSAYITVAIVAYAVTRTVHRIDWGTTFGKPMLCAAASVVLVCMLVKAGHSWMGLVVGLAAFAAAAIVTGTLRREDYGVLKAVFRRTAPADN